MLITLTTDFASKDPFVGVMKGVIFGIHPAARVVDLSHGLPPQDVMAAALVLKHAAPYFPAGTIHVAVVDPGVGSARRPILIESGGSYFVGPDNGVLSLAVESDKSARVFHLSNPAYHLRPTSATFHGRDIFAPAAAHLALRVSPEALGESLDGFAKIPWPRVAASELGIEGEILYIDGFGNLFTNIRESELVALPNKNLIVRVGALVIDGIARNYSERKPGDYLALINSWGLLEIAINQGNAQQASRAKRGDKVKILLNPQ
ncbi:MAG TPA: SAM-dependent chlorinase/fluorinase [Candidatus Binatia bacterium]|nr:SAM-dependent chlorinase/fluorinase [Candidatus Binatia bacterium]